MARNLFRTLLVSGLLFLLPMAALGKVVVPGTGDSQKLLRILAGEFAAKTRIEVEIPDSIGSFGGIRSVAEGVARLARVARPVKGNEAGTALNYQVFAYSAVVIVANHGDDCVTDLSRTQLVDIFSGKRNNWQQLQNCPPAKIYVANREPGDSSRMALENHLPQLGEVIGRIGKIVYTTPELIEILQNYPDTIGYAPLAMVDQNRLRVFSLEGIEPTVENVHSGQYPLVIPLGLVWKGELVGEEKRFFDFLFSDLAQRRIAELGMIPLQ